MRKLKVLVGCEYSGRVRDAFKKLGHDAWSCDLLDTEVPGQHYKGDVRDMLKEYWDNQTASGQNKLPPSKDRWKIRSRTYQGIADAMALQWSEYVLNYDSVSSAAKVAPKINPNTG